MATTALGNTAYDALWSEEDQFLVDLLLQENDAAIALVKAEENEEPEPEAAKNRKDKASACGQSRRRQSAEQRRAKHREVVRRAYHRTRVRFVVNCCNLMRFLLFYLPLSNLCRDGTKK